jgi:NADPH2:quinone reductase
MVAAVRVHKVGGPEVLTYEDIPVPAAGPGQIRVKQHAIGVNFVDTYFRSGLYPAPGGLPFVAGNEAAAMCRGRVAIRHSGSCRPIAR